MNTPVGRVLGRGAMALSLAAFGACAARAPSPDCVASTRAEPDQQQRVAATALHSPLLQALDRYEADRREAVALWRAGVESPCAQAEHRKPRPDCHPSEPLDPPFGSPDMIDDCTAVRIAEGYVMLEGWADAEPNLDLGSGLQREERAACSSMCTRNECVSERVPRECLAKLIAHRRHTVRGNRATGLCTLAARADMVLVYFERADGDAAPFVVSMNRCGEFADFEPMKQHPIAGLADRCYFTSSLKARGFVDWTRIGKHASDGGRGFSHEDDPPRGQSRMP